MKVVLVNPPSPEEFRVSRGLMGGFGMAVNAELLYPPIELAHVAGLLESEGFEVAIVDADAKDWRADDVLAHVKGIGPSLVCLDSSSTSLESDLALAGRIRSATGATVAMLGSQVTYTPEEIFNQGAIDCVVRGEPEHTVRDLAVRVRDLSDEKKADALELAGCTGISWKNHAGEVVHEEERDKIKHLDELPLPARHLLDNAVYRFPGVDGPITTVKSSRGCPLDCSFCGYTLAQGLRFRFRSPEHVLLELEDLYHKHGVRQVVFRDPIFTTRKDRVHAICDGIVERGLQLSWQCETAVKVLDRPLLKRMAEAGCTHISLGVESGNEEIQRKHCGAKLLDHDHAEEVFRACRDVGIETRAFCMIGFPEETEAMVEDTLNLVERLDPDQVQFCAVTAYPGTKLWWMLKDDKNFSYAAMTGYSAQAGNEHMTAEQIEGKIREAYRRFYRRPKRLFRELRHPMRLAGKVARYFSLFKRPA